jgi:hypothetical protein
VDGDLCFAYLGSAFNRHNRGAARASTTTEALVKIRGVVTQVLADEIVVSNEAARVRLGLKQAAFQYQDSREGPHFLRQISESDFRCCIELCPAHRQQMLHL